MEPDCVGLNPDFMDLISLCLRNNDKNGAYLIGLLWELNELIFVEQLQQWLAQSKLHLNVFYINIKTFTWETC